MVIQVCGVGKVNRGAKAELVGQVTRAMQVERVTRAEQDEQVASM